MDVENVEQLSMFEDEEKEAVEADNTLAADDEFKNAVYERMRKIHSDGMIVGFQTACHTALNKIYEFERNAGKKSTNDYKRCIKDLKKFFETGLSRKVNSEEVAESEENIEVETTQN